MSNLQTPNCQTGVAGADLRAHANKFVAFDANSRIVPCVQNSLVAEGGVIGVCYGAVGSLKAIAFAVEGNTDVFAANTIAPGQFVTVNSVSLATPCTSGQIAVAVSYQWAVPGQLARVEMFLPPWRHIGSGFP